MTTNKTSKGDEALVAAVRGQYAATALSGLSSEHAGVRAVAEAFGYSADELASIPAEANMGLSCGNPLALANLRPGEVMVDLGSGGGLDVLLAAGKVGPTGRAIGIDMTPEMVELARANAAKAGSTNVEFHLAHIDALPLADASADVVVSNCVINLAPDKPAVLREIFRVLKPGGRVAVSDIALRRALPDDLAADIGAYVGCVAGAVLVETYRQQLIEAGFDAVHVQDAGADLNAYKQVEGQSACCSPATPEASNSGGCCGAPAPEPVGLTIGATRGGCCSTTSGHDAKAKVHAHLGRLIDRYDLNDYAVSVKVYAVKPR